MKTPLAWISLYTDISEPIAKNSIKSLAHAYSIHTAEIDGIEEHFLDKVVVGKVVSCEKHPESKKLSIVRVNLGELGEETILTGAQNITEATYVVVATVGAVLPGDFVIGERVMAGMMSRGMICGTDEIGLSTEESTGIMILEEIWERDLLENMIGKSFFDLELPFPGANGKKYLYPLRDTTFEIDNKFITNRPDLFGVYGNAREWGAVFGGKFEEYQPTAPVPETKGNLSVKVDTPYCLAYNAIKMENVEVKKSPLGITLMMERAGLSPKLDCIDITNCILAEFGQPMHVFDADKIHGEISVTMAKDGEKFVALNGQEYTLTKDDVVIRDEKSVLALAGIIGGLESGVTENTKNIIWESATFDAVKIRLSAQKHGLRTDASTRYEKSLDPLLSAFVLPRVGEYMEFLGKKGEITDVFSFIREESVKKITLEVEYDFISSKAGTKIEKESIHTILKKLGFAYEIEDNGLKITVPSWRASKDISIKEDIVEEVLRIYGYDNIPLVPLSGELTLPIKNTERSLRNVTLSHFRENLWHEVYNYSFSNTTLDAKIGFLNMENAIAIQNAFNEEYTHMRRSLAVRLFENIANNLKYQKTLQFFEIGNIYAKDITLSKQSENLLQEIPHKPFSERKMIAGVSLGVEQESLKNTLENFLKRIIGFVPPLHQNTENILPFLHPGMSGKYSLNGDTILQFGKIHPETAESFEIPNETLYFEADMETLLVLSREKEIVFQPISRFQSIPRELNFVMDEKVQTGEVAKLIDSEHPWIHDVVVDSIYRDAEKIGVRKKSVNFSFVLQSLEETISDEQALHLQNTLIKKLEDNGYTLRGN